MKDAGAAVATLTAVSHHYGAVTALDHITLAIPAGRMVGLIGPDSVGKSTLLALISGVRTIQTGDVQVLGGDMRQKAHRDRVCTRIAYMPQGLGRNLYPTLSVRENIDFFGRLFGQSAHERRWRIDELLDSVGLRDFADRPAAKLSGGMKQKLSLCCSLIHDPDLLILDEPTTGVDPLSRKQFWELIARIRSRRAGMSVLVATAYMEEAELFDHLIAMDGGHVLMEGTNVELKEKTGATTLENAFIALLPPERRAGFHEVDVPPFQPGDGVPAIRAEGLTKCFGDFVAVADVNIKIEKGEIFGFLGSNGCGKTTTMKMLTGLLKPTEGRAELFGQAVNGNDIETRRRVGYMSQSFSLYTELTVRQNLDLHAELFHLAPAYGARRIDYLLERFDLGSVVDQLPESLPLGVRQRLQLAVAVLHEPEMLILDEPTSGVDPIARNGFWELLVELSRKEGVTIFISTHFINEAVRCDRISLMHAGRILAMDKPEALRLSRAAPTLEAAFIGYLEDAAGESDSPAIASPVDISPAPKGPDATIKQRLFSPGRVWAFARREALELARDRIRLAFALISPLFLLMAMSFGISFDIEHISYAALDQDQSPESRMFLENFAHSRYFVEQPALKDTSDLERRLVSNDMYMALIVPPDYGRDLLADRKPEISVWLDGASSFRAETTRGYVQGEFMAYLQDMSKRATGEAPSLYPADIETRFRYNQAFLSLYAISPGALMLLLMMLPAMLTAVAVVREKELGSITNLYAAPAQKLEFLIGKQLPYIGLAMMSFFLLLVEIRFAFQVPLAGNFFVLVLGALLFTTASTGFGLFISTFVNSQIAAIFATSILALIPTQNFSGMIYPVSTLNGPSRMIGELFPAMYFQKISAGVFNKGLGFADLGGSLAALAGFSIAFLLLSAWRLKKQDK